MCGPPDVPTLLLFAHLDQKTVVQPVFRPFGKLGGPQLFWCPYLAERQPYKVIWMMLL